MPNFGIRSFCFLIAYIHCISIFRLQGLFSCATILAQMRPSPLRHPLAVLRYIIGLGQQDLADLCGCSRPTIQAVELLKLRLSKNLAIKIADATGVNVAWLLDSNPNVPANAGPYPARERFIKGRALPRGNRAPDQYGKEIFNVGREFWDSLPLDWTIYTRELFETHRALLERAQMEDPASDSTTAQDWIRDRAQIEMQALIHIERLDNEIIDLCRKLLSSTQRNRDNYVIRWQIKNFLNNLISKIRPEKSSEPETKNKRKLPSERKRATTDVAVDRQEA